MSPIASQSASRSSRGETGAFDRWSGTDGISREPRAAAGCPIRPRRACWARAVLACRTGNDARIASLSRELRRQRATPRPGAEHRCREPGFCSRYRKSTECDGAVGNSTDLKKYIEFHARFTKRSQDDHIKGLVEQQRGGAGGHNPGMYPDRPRRRRRCARGSRSVFQRRLEKARATGATSRHNTAGATRQRLAKYRYCPRTPTINTCHAMLVIIHLPAKRWPGCLSCYQSGNCRSIIAASTDSNTTAADAITSGGPNTIAGPRENAEAAHARHERRANSPRRATIDQRLHR